MGEGICPKDPTTVNLRVITSQVSIIGEFLSVMPSGAGLFQVHFLKLQWFWCKREGEKQSLKIEGISWTCTCISQSVSTTIVLPNISETSLE